MNQSNPLQRPDRAMKNPPAVEIIGETTVLPVILR